MYFKQVLFTLFLNNIVVSIIISIQWSKIMKDNFGIIICECVTNEAEKRFLHVSTIWTEILLISGNQKLSNAFTPTISSLPPHNIIIRKTRLFRRMILFFFIFLNFSLLKVTSSTKFCYIEKKKLTTRRTRHTEIKNEVSIPANYN